MSGGITQLVAIGAQDAHLVGDPQVSFFRSNYKRHTNFAHVIERSTIQGNPSAGGMSSVRFERKGDLLGYVYLTAVATATNASTTVNATDIDKIEFLIGGQVIDTQDSNYSLHIGQHLGTSAAGKASSDTAAAGGMGSFTYPLHFSFCENWQSAIPMVALQYHDVEIRIRWATITTGAKRYSVHSSFIYLDTAEREELSNAPQDMLITQVQKSITSASKIQELNFNHPIKFLAASSNLITTVGRSVSSKLKLQINGVDVGEDRVYAPHFNSTPFYFHCPYSLPLGSNCSPGNGFLYPFCLETNKLQPTGSLNFSRLDSARLITDDAAGIGGTDIYTDIYGVNYNILRVQNGMGGLMYAN